ncbi:MAG: hypothetical protein IH586_24060 [Anaerolineaceae bacterium]|nr:hypothetical protein [Anaerolineaceae bacterium]
MTRWLYNSDGDPIAFIQGDNVFTTQGDFFGKIYPDQQVWNGDYLGELFADDRLIYNATKLHGNRKMPGLAGLPAYFGEPPFKGPVTIPLGYRDVDIR